MLEYRKFHAPESMEVVGSPLHSMPHGIRPLMGVPTSDIGAATLDSTATYSDPHHKGRRTNRKSCECSCVRQSIHCRYVGGLTLNSESLYESTATTRKAA